MAHYSNCKARFVGNKQQCEQIEAWLLSKDVQTAPKRQLVSMDGTTKSKDNDTWEITFRWPDMLGIASEHMECFDAAGVRHLEIIHAFK